MRIVLIGPPGAGNGTQAQRLAKKYGMTHLSSGDIFRAEKASGSELGKKLAAIIDRGELVPDDVVVSIMAKAIKKAGDSLLLDGFPRTVAQAESLDETLAGMGERLDAVVVIKADDNAIIERITGRRYCPSTGKVYHIRFMPPKTEGLDDETGEKLVQRDDDREAVVRERLEVYHRQTSPVIEYYRRSGVVKVVEIDGMGSPDEVTVRMTQAVESLKK
ncbi:MAG TPA: adenylate kinase [Phycisphaerae bacterium]|nr:adenylate kinase [Phycisphaerae bacterium]